MTLRIRITLITTFVLAVVLTAFGAGVYVLLNKTLHENLDRDITHYAAEVITAIDSGVDPGSYFGRVDFIAELLDPTGTPLPIQPFNAQAFLPNTVRALSVASDRTARSFYEDVTVHGVPLRLFVVHVNSIRYDGALQVAAPRRAITETLRRLRNLLLYAGLIGVGLAAILAWQSARAALRPVEEVAEAAGAIGATGDLSRRVDPGPQSAKEDELGKLVTAFNSMLDRLEDAQQTLERTVEGQRRFLADASHELRTPLTTMRGNLEVMRSSPEMPTQDRADALRDSIEEAERMSSLIEDLLALARADAKAPMPVEPVALAEVAREAIALASGAHEAGTPVSLHDDASVVVNGSADLLRRLISNLVENAIKYTPATGRIDVAVTREQGWAVVRVTDTGIGMSAEELETAFERFWRSDRSRGERGSGLGLAIAKSVAADHGGSIEAQSAEGHGTTMTVRFPLSPGAAVPQTSAQTGDHGEMVTGV